MRFTRGSERSLGRNSGIETLGFVFQGYFLLPELTAMENVHAALHDPRQGGAGRGGGRLGRWGWDRMHHLPSELSGGEQQRVAIARALMNDPAIIFADEPTGNLDSKTGRGIVDLLLRWRGKNRKHWSWSRTSKSCYPRGPPA